MKKIGQVKLLSLSIIFGLAMGVVFGPNLVHRVAAQAPVTLYQDCNFSGTAYQFSGDISDLSNYGFTGPAGVSSLKVAPGYAVTLFSDASWQSRLQAFDSDNSCLVNTYIGNDAAKSMTVQPLTLGGVTLYSNCNYSGSQWTFTGNVHDFTQTANLNDAVSSLKVPWGEAVVLYNDINYVGGGQTFTSDNACLDGSRIGSHHASSLIQLSALGNIQYQLSTDSDWAQLELTGPESWNCNAAFVTSWIGEGTVSCSSRVIRIGDGHCSFTCPTVTAAVGVNINGLRSGDTMVDYLMTKGDRGTLSSRIVVNGKLIGIRTDGWDIPNNPSNNLEFSVPSVAHTGPGDISNKMIYILKTKSDWTSIVLTGSQWWADGSITILQGINAPGLGTSWTDKTMRLSKYGGDTTEVWAKFTVTIHNLNFGDANPNSNDQSNVGYDIQTSGLEWTNLDIYQGFTPTQWPTQIYSAKNTGGAHLNLKVSTNDHIFWKNIVGAFYYPWWGNSTDGWYHWKESPVGQIPHYPPNTWASNYEPDYLNSHVPATNLYSSRDPSIVEWQAGYMKMAMVDVAIASWWGCNAHNQADPCLQYAKDKYEDESLKRIIGDPLDYVDGIVARPDNPYPGLKWAILYEKGWANTLGSDEIYADLSYVLLHYGDNPNYLRVDGKPVVFVFGVTDTDVGNWLTAKQALVTNLQKNVFLNVYPRQWFTGCVSIGACLDENSDTALRVSDAYYDYNSNAASRETSSCMPICPYTSDSPRDQSWTAHTGYWEYPELCAVHSWTRSIDPHCNTLSHDSAMFANSWNGVGSSRDTYRFLLANTWNEYHEGSMMEPGRQIIHDDASFPFPDANNNYGTGFIDAMRNGVGQFKLGAPLVDYVPPTGSMTPLSSSSAPNFQVSWSGTDNIGIGGFDVQYQDSTIGGQWTGWLNGVPWTSSNFFYGICGHTFGFRLQVRDTSGNVRLFPSTSETSTTVSLSCTIVLTSYPASLAPDGASTSTIIAHLADGASGIPVTFTTTLGRISPSSCTTNIVGYCSVMLTSASTPGAATVMASATNYSNGQLNVPFYGYRDDFSYQTITALTSAGWTQCGSAPQSYWIMSNGVLTLQNDGSTGANVCWTQIPSGITEWSVSTRTDWSGGSYGNLGLIVSTSTHSYLWQADGYYQRWDLQRDGQWNPYATLSYPGYAPQLNVWHTLAMDMRQGTLYLRFDGQLMGTYPEATPGVLTQIILPSEWSSYDSYDCVTASQIGSLSFSLDPPCSPPGHAIAFSPTATFGSSPYTFSWNFGDGSSTSSSSSISHTYIATGSYVVTLTATDAAGLARTTSATITISNPDGPGLYALRDDFGYSSLTSMTTAGWTVCGKQSQVNIGGGVLSLTNDGSTVGSMCWTNISAGVTSWTVTDRGRYTQVLGGLSSSRGGIWLTLTTASHTYQLDLDGYYSSYYLWRDGVKVKTVSGYAGQLGIWHDLALDMRNGMLSAIVDGKIITTYTETAGTNNALTSITMKPGWKTVTSYDWTSATQVNDLQPAGFMIGFSPISVSANAGQNAATTINLSSLAGFTGIVNLATQISPTTGLTCNLNPSSISLSSSST